MEKYHELENEIIEFDKMYPNKRSKNIVIGNNVSDKTLTTFHRTLKFELQHEEKILLLLNPKKGIIFYGFTGVVITNMRIFVSPLKRSFFASLIPLRAKTASIPLAQINSFQIGEHDTCFGTAYVGHNFMINGIVLGLVRLGVAVLYDEEARNYINILSSYLHELGYLKEKPVEYIWQ